MIEVDLKLFRLKFKMNLLVVVMRLIIAYLRTSSRSNNQSWHYPCHGVVLSVHREYVEYNHLN
jgi:hypothetical protein